MNTERLLKMADMLEFSVVDEQFDLSIWKSRCGAIGCACGHYSMHYPEELTIRVHGPITNWENIRRLFELNVPQSYHLFNSDFYEYPSRLSVVTRIRGLVSEYLTENPTEESVESTQEELVLV